MTKMFDALVNLKNGNGRLPFIVVAGGGQWALQYANALHWFIVQKKIKAVFFYSSEYGLGQPQYHKYLKNTLDNMIKAEQLGATCIDLSRLNKKEQSQLPEIIKPKAVFVVTPPETHCKEAIKWVGKAEYIFIEKPFDTNLENIKLLKSKITNDNNSKVMGFDHYAARLKPFLTRKELTHFGFGKCKHFSFEMFEAFPRGLEERAPSIGSGMLFDMASHALPVLSWLAADIKAIRKFKKLYASTLLSPANKPYINAETFGRLEFDFTLASGSRKDVISADIRVGKGIGATDSKVVTLTDQDGQRLYLDQWFMLARGPKKQMFPIHEKVIHVLVERVITNNKPEKSDGVFDIDIGASFVDVLVHWTKDLKKHIESNRLATYQQGWFYEQICQKGNAYIIDNTAQ